MPRISLELEVATPKQTVMTMTDAAAAKVAELLAAEASADDMALRVAVRPGGCSGFSYEMYFDSEIALDDHVAEKAGVRLVVDPASAPHVTGAVLDYKEGLMDAGFAIENPSAERTCGCGESFS